MFRAKAFFKQCMYTCASLIPNDYSGKKVLTQEQLPEQTPPPSEQSLISTWWRWCRPKLAEQGLLWRSCRCCGSKELNTIPTYEDYFMAIAFLASARSKDRVYQVGSCVVSSYPHRLVGMGYNGLPDGGFREEQNILEPDGLYREEEDIVGTKKKNLVCHAELNALITASRGGADLSSSTLYITHSPCKSCCKLIAQSGIKNVVYAKYYGDDHFKHLKPLPDMKIMEYTYKKSGYKNIAKMTIDLQCLTVTLENSDKKPIRYVDTNKQPGIRGVNFPLDDYFMALAVLAKARCSYEKKVGACIVLKEPHRAISVGYNGFPDGFKKDGIKPEHYKDFECCAESNAILSALRHHVDLTGSILYTTSPPCPKCAQMIVQSGIKTVFYGNACDGYEQEMKEEAVRIFYQGKIATLKYKPFTTKKTVVIDLSELSVERPQ